MDDLREFEDLLKSLNDDKADFIKKGEYHKAGWMHVFYVNLDEAIQNCKRRHQQENSALSVDIGEPLPRFLQKQQSIEENTND